MFNVRRDQESNGLCLPARLKQRMALKYARITSAWKYYCNPLCSPTNFNVIIISRNSLLARDCNIKFCRLVLLCVTERQHPQWMRRVLVLIVNYGAQLLGSNTKSVFTDSKLFCTSIMCGTDTVYVNMKYMDNNTLFLTHEKKFCLNEKCYCTDGRNNLFLKCLTNRQRNKSSEHAVLYTRRKLRRY